MFLDLNLGQASQNWAQKQFFFFHFLKFGSLDFLGIAYNDSLQPCLTSCRDKTHEKKNVQIWAKIRSKLGQNFLKLSLLVFL